MSQAEIILVRHGRSALNPEARRVTASEIREWIDRYHQLGIAAESLPPDSLIEHARTATLLVCSDLPRAIESAHRIAPSREPDIYRLLREAGSPPRGRWGGIRLPLTIWVIVSQLLWRLGLFSSGEPIAAARLRAREAAGLLEDLARDHGHVLVVGHGNFNQLVARELKHHGWQGPRRTASKNWDATIYRRN